MTPRYSRLDSLEGGSPTARLFLRDLEAVAPATSRPPLGARLRRSLVLLDALAVAMGWAVALVRMKPATPAEGRGILVVLAVVVPAALAVMACQHLYRSRVCSVRAVETERLVRTSLFAAVVALALTGPTGAGVTVHDAAVGAGAMFLLLRAGRTAFGGYLHAGRRAGRFGRPVVLVGANEEAYDLHRLLDQHPELGYRVVGFVGDPAPIDRSFSVPWLGAVVDTERAVADTGATGVVVAATALDTVTLNRLTRALTERSIHVHLSSGVRGIAQNRLRAQPFAHEPLFYVEPQSRPSWQLAAKRAIDIVLASVGLVLTLPVLLLAALAIKLQDRGPVLFRQQRVGRDGRRFTIVKLRTMVPDSERLYDHLASTRAGRSGPLVKLHDDPRITRVGHFLRSSSIDELPQLLNVLTGSMSLVGPRPNLVVEAEALDAGFAAQKGRMRPGITGLWQVEARDNPSFDVYRRLDVFYVENWSMAFDASILAATVRRVLGRAFWLLLPARLGAALGPVGATALK